MDKPTRERKIIVNINGEKKEYKWIPSEDPNSLDTIKEIASTVEEEQTPPVWILPEKEQAEKNEKEPVKSKKTAFLKFVQSNKLRVLATGIPILIALMTGTIFGIVVLKIVLFGGEAKEAVKVPNSISVSGSKTSEPSASKKMIKEMNAFVVQGGVYSSKTAAEQRASLIEDDGLPSIILKQGDKYYIYIGAASSLEETKKLALLYKEQGFETYWKEIRIEGETKNAYTEKETEMIDHMIYNIGQYTKLAAGAQLNNHSAKSPKLKPIQLENIPQELQNLHNLSESMNKTWSAYQSNQEAASLIQLQKCILQFIDEWYKL